MKNLNDIAVIIQARLNSERLPRKMIKPFADTTLSDVAIDKVLKSKVIPKENFYFSVYEQELAQLGRKRGVNLFMRSLESANYDGLEPISLMYEWWDKIPYKYAVLINGCVPFLKTETIDNFVKAYAESDSDGMFGVIEKRNYFWNKDGQFITEWPEGQTCLNTKRVDFTYEAAHCLYAGRLDRLKHGIWMGDFNVPGEIELFPMKEEEAFDIDCGWQFNMAAAQYVAQKKN